MRIWRSAFWIILYFTLAIAPLFAMHVGPTPPGRGYWREFSVGLAFSALSMMGLQFFLTGRFKNVTAPYGIDVVYHFHRGISIIAFLFILLHPLLIFAASPEALALLRPANLTWPMISGLAALMFFAAVIATSVYRRTIGLGYERWRVIHGYGAVAAAAFSVAHIIGVDYYVGSHLKRWLWIAMAGAWLCALVYVRLVVSYRMLRRPYLIEGVRRERGSSWTLTLRPDGHGGMAFRPGQFAWLTVGESPFSIREHPFSFSSSAMEPTALQMTVKELGDFSSQVRSLQPGTRAYIDGPYGSFTPDGSTAPGFCFIAGGVGVTPVMSMLRTLRDRGDARPVILIYGSRTWEEVIFREELEKLEQQMSLKVVHVLDRPAGDWTGASGTITAELLARHLPGERADLAYFICGPPRMQQAVKVALERLGLPTDHVHSESFNFV